MIMVRVANSAANKVIAWRVRDAMARHPSLNSATARITVHTRQNMNGQHIVVLEGWALDERVRQLAARLAVRAAGCHAVQVRVHTRTARATMGANEKYTLLLSSDNETPTTSQQ
jgi:alkylhydroperoxidase/carboxymuconolactone decarboxylase family protein YurZ